MEPATICLAHVQGAVTSGDVQKLLAEFNTQLEKDGKLIRQGVALDVSVVESTACPRKPVAIEEIADDREEPELSKPAEFKVTRTYSHDSDAAWLKKGKTSHLRPLRKCVSLSKSSFLSVIFSKRCCFYQKFLMYCLFCRNLDALLLAESQKDCLFQIESDSTQQKLQFHLGDAQITGPSHAIHLFERAESPLNCPSYSADHSISLLLPGGERMVTCGLVHDAVFELVLFGYLSVEDACITFVAKYSAFFRHPYMFEHRIQFLRIRTVRRRDVPGEDETVFTIGRYVRLVPVIVPFAFLGPGCVFIRVNS